MFWSIWPKYLRLPFQTEISGPALGLSSTYVTRDSLSIKLSPKRDLQKREKEDNLFTTRKVMDTFFSLDNNSNHLCNVNELKLVIYNILGPNLCIRLFVYFCISVSHSPQSHLMEFSVVVWPGGRSRVGSRCRSKVKLGAPPKPNAITLTPSVADIIMQHHRPLQILMTLTICRMCVNVQK